MALASVNPVRICQMRTTLLALANVRDQALQMGGVKSDRLQHLNHLGVDLLRRTL